MSRRKGLPRELWDEKNQELENFIYENGLEDDYVQFSTYHFRLKNKIDVWCGRKKFMVKGSTNSRTYEHINELLKFI